MLTVVPDTTVLVSAAISSQGNPYRILRAWQEGELSLVVCPQLLAELRDVLLRDRLRRFIPREEALAFVEYLSRVADVRSDPHPIARLVPGDAGDDYLIALAREAGVDYVLSGDQHLTALRSSHPPVVTPAQLVAKLERRRR
jgi:putative PIN family toxin of toxin-antitoxin system